MAEVAASTVTKAKGTTLDRVGRLLAPVVVVVSAPLFVGAEYASDDPTMSGVFAAVPILAMSAFAVALLTLVKRGAD